ncbi:L-lactate MFS transporter [Desulforhabdus amnigena]|uniref:MFS transporter n=1 Tax=Desulforhabdus amnigena TaxID=40218 RepID=A0A9W6LBE3_9BACT|nr:MFS transporter [Desulforhabdus amnigena]NLJ28686.1 OFA family MFS transporter [Deltaproteobacteria bacterium]GLI36481.1 MFS transporter [Desulforhabdus amnigena]
MAAAVDKVPGQAWVVTFAGTAINLCLGILYAWSVWKANLLPPPGHVAGEAMTGLNEGWVYLTDAQATWAYAICGVVFALFMIPGGRIQDKYGAKVGATLGGLLLALGCIVAGLMKSYTGLVIGFGLLGGMGMGIGYAAPTPAAVKWFGPHKRGLIVGLVVGGYGGAAIYIAPLGKWLIANYGISGSFITLGVAFAIVVIVAGQLLAWPPEGYVPPGAPATATASKAVSMTKVDWTASDMVKTIQFYALIFMFMGCSQSGLLVIANATPMLGKTAATVAFFAANAWLLAAYGGLVNASGRIGTGLYSDKIGRSNAYVLNGIISSVCLFAMPAIMKSGSIFLLFLAVGIAYWQYGGGLSLIPAFTADFFGAKNLGFNYGLVFIGWGLAFFVPQVAGYIKDATGSLDYAFYLSGLILVAAVIVSRIIQRPVLESEKTGAAHQPAR